MFLLFNWLSAGVNTIMITLRHIPAPNTHTHSLKYMLHIVPNSRPIPVPIVLAQVPDKPRGAIVHKSAYQCHDTDAHRSHLFTQPNACLANVTAARLHYI